MVLIQTNSSVSEFRPRSKNNLFAPGNAIHRCKLCGPRIAGQTRGERERESRKELEGKGREKKEGKPEIDKSTNLRKWDHT